MSPRALTIVSILSVAAVSAAVMVSFRSLAPELIYPVEHAWHSLKQATTEDAEVTRLKREVASLALVQRQLEETEAENDRLRKALGFAQAKREAYIPAEILSEGGGASAPYRMLRVAAGSLAGIREGAVVVAPEGLVGRVTLVTQHTSEVTLITDPSVKVSAEIELTQGEKAYGIAAGGTEDFIVLKYLNEYRGRLPVHSRVLTSGRGGVFPAGLEIGTSLVEPGDEERGVDGVQPAVDFSSLKEVFICRDR